MISKRRKGLVIYLQLIFGMTVIFPSRLALLVMLIMIFLTLIGRKRFGGSSRFDVVALSLCIAIPILSISPSVALGDTEAMLFLQRFLACGVASVSALLISFQRSRESFEIFLMGIFYAVMMNAIVVIITAVRPDLYDLLRIETLSGFNANLRYLRSPGLVAGFDYAGMLSAFGFMISFWRFHEKCLSLGVFLMHSVIFLSATMLSSRSSMIVLVFVLIVIFLDPKFRSVSLRFLLIFSSIPLVYVASILSLGLIDPSYIEYLTFGRFTQYDIELIYNLGSLSDYTTHFDTSKIQGFATDAASFYPDNFYFRLLYAGGIFAAIPVFLILLYLSAALLSSEKGSTRIIYRSFVIIIVLMSAKTNYFFYLPVWLIIVNLFIFRDRRRTIK